MIRCLRQRRTEEEQDQDASAEQSLLHSDRSRLVLDQDPDDLPDTLEEAEILMDTNIKTDAEVAAQVATNMTLSWNNFNDSTFRRCVNDLADLACLWSKRDNDPNYGIAINYVDPKKFVHSRTEDPNFEDLVYAGSREDHPIQRAQAYSYGTIH